MLKLRPVRPEDAEIEAQFVRGLSDSSRYSRFMSALKELSPAMVARFTQIDYDREMALMAVLEREGREVQVGVARYVTNPDGESCEFAIAVADEWQRHGLGRRLLDVLSEAGEPNIRREVLRLEPRKGRALRRALRDRRAIDSDQRLFAALQ